MSEQPWQDPPGDTEEADERYRRLIERSRVGLFQTALDGSIRWVNQAAAELVGYPDPASFIAEVSDIREIYVDPSRREEFERVVAREGRVSDFEYEIRRRDGSNRWISVSATPMLTPSGELEGFEGTVVDVTEAKLIQAAAAAISSELEPQESVQRFADVLRRVVPFLQLTLGVIEGDRYRRVVSITAQPGQSRLPAGEWVPLEGNSMSAVIATKAPVVIQDTAAGEWPFDLRLKEVGVGSYAIFPLMDGSQVFATFNIGMKDSNAFNDEMVELLGKHTSAVSQAVKHIVLFENQREAVDRLTEIDRLKNEFFAEVSHDLRHPLTVIMGIAQVLGKDWDGYDDQRKQDLIAMIARNAEALSDLLARDLEVALIESGEMVYEMETFDLQAVIEEQARSFGGVHPDRHIDVSIDADLPPVFGDPRRQKQILQNLMSNAEKFSPAGSHIRIEAGMAGDEVHVSVTDEGPGIPEDQKDRLFRRLSRLERSGPGTGLGLYITHSMVVAQQGRIWVTSAPGQGTTFTYTIRCAGTGV